MADDKSSEGSRRFSTKKGWYRHPRRREAEALLRQGQRPKEVAARVEVDYRTVWYWRKRLRLPRLGPRPKHPGFAAARRLLEARERPRAVAAKLGVNLYTIYRWRKQMGAILLVPLPPSPPPPVRIPPPPSEERRQCEALMRAGRSAGDAAAALGLSAHTVQRWREKMGLPSPHEVRKQRGLALLREGAAPSLVAAETGVSLRLVRAWRKETRPVRRTRQKAAYAKWQADRCGAPEGG